MESFAAVCGLFGLVVGSFLNVCIYRLPRRESIVWPRSRCPKCGKAIAAHDNIPLLSYVWLGGRCRSCRGPISLQYPAVELLTGAAFFACARTWWISGPTFVNSLFLAAIIVLTFVDFQHQILPNMVTIPGAVAGILLSGFQDPRFYSDAVSFRLAGLLAEGAEFTVLPWAGSFLGALIGGGSLLAVGTAYKLVRKKPGLGMGDVKMMAMVGAFLGWRMCILTMFLGSALGSVIGIFLILFRGKSLQTRLAFGTLLGIASAVLLFYGLAFLQWYNGPNAAQAARELVAG